MPKGLKPVRRKLASGEVRLYWYHRATGKALQHDPATAEGLLEVAALDRRVQGAEAVLRASEGTWAHLWQEYRKSPRWTSLKPRTRSDYQAVRDWIGQGAHKMILGRITPGDIERLRDKASTAKGRRFGNYVVQVLRLTLEWGVKREMLATNPAMKAELVSRPRGAPKVNRAWTDAEVEAFANAAPTHLLVPFALGLFAGMRQGDALKVTWSAYRDGAVNWIAGKNGEDCSAPVTGPFKTILDAAKARRGAAVQIAVTSGGSPWSESGFRASFFKVLRDLRDAGAIMPGCTFHGLRHTIATTARNAGESESRVAAGIGDRSAAMAAVYGRDADRATAQIDVLTGVQKRFANIDWKTTAADRKMARPARPRKTS